MPSLLHPLCGPVCQYCIIMYTYLAVCSLVEEGRECWRGIRIAP